MNLFENILKKAKSGLSSYNTMMEGVGSKLYDVQQNVQLKQQGNVIQAFLNESQAKPELQSKRNAIIQMIQNGEDDSFIQDTIVNKMGYNTDVGIGGRIGSALGRRLEIAGESYMQDKTGFEKGLSAAKDVIATPFDVIGAVAQPVIEPIIKPVVETAPVQYGMKKYGEFRESNPRLAQNIEAGAGILSAVAPFTKTGQAVMKAPGKAIASTVEKVAPKVVQGTKNIITKTPQVVGKGATTGAEYTTSLATGLSREAQQTIKQSPKLYKEARLGNITAQGELENFVKATEARLTDLSELGTGYDAIKKGNKVASIDDITSAYVKATEGVRDTTLTKADKLVLKDANDYMSQMKGQLDETDILGLRRQLDSIMYDPNTSLKRKLSPTGERVVQTMRAEIDKIAKERIPGLTELDAKYGPEVSLLKDVKKQIYDANGNIKPTALSTISNIVGKNKDFKLEQFQKIYPELGARIKALKAFEEVQSLGEIKTGSVIRQGGAIAAGSAVAPGVGTVIGWMATNPHIVARVLELYGVAKAKISEILKKGSKATPEDVKIVQKAVQSTPKEKMTDIINNLSYDAKRDALTSKTLSKSPITLSTKGTMERKVLKQSPDIDKKPYTLGIKKPIVKRSADVDSGLIEEARKYKSAEEFIKAQGEPVYHGTTYDWKGDFNTDRVFLSKFRNEAEGYAGEQVNNIINRLETETAPNGKSYRPTIKEVFIKKGTKIFDPNKSSDLERLSNVIKGKEFNAVDAYGFGKVKLSGEEIIKGLADKTQRENWTLFEGDIIDVIKKLGYDGWISKERGKETIGILNKNAIKTKDQLIDIYQKSNK